MELRKALRLGDSPCLAFVGAGGKTSLLFQLASEFNPPVILSASTHLSKEQVVPRGKTNFERHLIKGMPREVLSSFAADHEIDLVLMGTVCRTGIAGMLIGNTAEYVLQQVDCSVLAVKPDGFVSPITA